MKIRLFRKKPVVVEAVRFTAEDWREIEKWGNGKINAIVNEVDGELVPVCAFIEALEGRLTALFGQWIIRGIKGEFYPCDPDIFEQTYELVVTLVSGHNV